MFINNAFDHVWIGQIPDIFGFIINDFNKILENVIHKFQTKNAVYFSW